MICYGTPIQEEFCFEESIAGELKMTAYLKSPKTAPALNIPASSSTVTVRAINRYV